MFFYIPKLLWDDISSCNITDGWMLTSYLDIQKWFLIFLNLTKLSPDQKMDLIWYPRVPTVFIIICNSKNKFIWLLMSRKHVISLFLPSLGEIRLEDFGLLVIYRIVYFGVVFYLVFQIFINSCMYVFSNSNPYLIKFMAVFFSMRFLKL